MMVDISHTSYQTQLDALNQSNAPVIFSHSSVYDICNHTRNVRNDVLQLLVNKKRLKKTSVDLAQWGGPRQGTVNQPIRLLI